MTRLVVCCDGTWNKPEQLDGGVAAPTNVVRLYNAVAPGTAQQVYYHPGVGTGESWWDEAIGGGTGTGLSRNIKSAYDWLARNYKVGDQIYLFGFSRGAYTVRSLAGFIAHCGLLRLAQHDRAGAWQAIDKLFEQGYRNRKDIAALRESIGQNMFHMGPGDELPIRFIGVWDTVGSLGIPDDLGILNLLDRPERHAFHSTQLGRNVEIARHALAMDEQRKSFQPTLWTGPFRDGQSVRQLWFPGVHSDVGGGYREAGLANGALLWMVGEAQAAGLEFRQSMLDQIMPNHLDMMHDPYKGVFAMMPSQPRAIPPLLDEAPFNAQFHASALKRHLDPPIHQCPYRQPHIAADGRALEIFARQQWNATGLWLEEGRTYKFVATGEWVDSSIACGPGGTADGHFELGELAHVTGAMLGRVKEAFRALTGNENAQLHFTRRHEKFNWFALVGAIANGGGEREHEAFEIGEGCTYTPVRSGYLYAYANDAWNCYANNKGFVTLSVELSS